MRKRKPALKWTAAERQLEAEMERGDWKPVSRDEARRLGAEMVEAARGRNKDARVNLRLNPDDVSKIRDKAEREGVPYQTLIASVLHKFATDQFLDEKAVQLVAEKIGLKKASGQ